MVGIGRDGTITVQKLEGSEIRFHAKNSHFMASDAPTTEFPKGGARNHKLIMSKASSGLESMHWRFKMTHQSRRLPTLELPINEDLKCSSKLRQTILA
jgi:hypothetical protein